MAVYSGDAAKQLQARATQLYTEAIKAIETFREAEKNGRLARVSGKQIGEARAKLGVIHRLGKRLQILGEPCGVDFELRAEELMALEMFAAWPQFPSSANYLNSARTKLSRQEQARVKAAKKLQQMIAKDQWQAAEDELYRILDFMEVDMCFLNGEARARYLLPFAKVRHAIDTTLYAKRVATAKEYFTRSRAEQTPDFDAQLAAMSEAVKSVETTGQANLDGEAFGGPQLVGKFGLRWKEGHVATLRCRAFDWAQRSRAGRDATNPDTAGLESKYATFSTEVIATITKLIAADAARVADAEAASLHAQYLTTLAPLARQISDRDVVSSWDAALQQLAAKSPELAADAADFEQGTAEILRWRARVASALADSRLAGAAKPDALMFAATQSESGYPGFHGSQKKLALLGSAPQNLPPAAEKLVGSQAIVANVVRVTATSRGAIASYANRCYANVPAGLDLDSEVNALKFDLLVTDQAPPLTLESAIAVHSAERGDLVAAGGEISGTHVEGLITRFAGLPTAASVLVPLGILTEDKPREVGLQSILIRIDLQPAWVQHEQFFFELAGNE
jgi:hypothetical protein